jgi:hypothetical protein
MHAADSLLMLERYGPVILAARAVAEQLGVPVPAVPALLRVGALPKLGSRRGAGILAGLCGLSLELNASER